MKWLVRGWRSDAYEKKEGSVKYMQQLSVCVKRCGLFGSVIWSESILENGEELESFSGRKFGETVHVRGWRCGRQYMAMWGFVDVADAYTEILRPVLSEVRGGRHYFVIGILGSPVQGPQARQSVSFSLLYIFSLTHLYHKY